MRANNGSGHNITRDEWQTPNNIFLPLKKQYKFNFDCCANTLNKKTKSYSKDFLKYMGSKYNIHWLNPPFSKADLIFKHFFKVVLKGIAIYRCDNLETKLWQDIILKKADWIFFIKGRVHYIGLKGGGSRFPSALIGKGVNPPKYIKGVTLWLRN